MVIAGGRLIDGTGRPPMPNTAIVIKNGYIMAVGPEAQVDVSRAEPAVRLDARGLAILPGLIDSHVHLTFSAGPDHSSVIRQLAEDPDERLLLRASRQAQLALAAGITTVRDCGGKGVVTIGLRDAIKAGHIIGPQVLACGMPITTKAGHMHFLGLEADGENELRSAVRSQVRAGADFIKVCATGGNMTSGSNPRRAQYSLAELTAAVTESHRLGCRVASHAIGAEGIRYSVEAGADTIEHFHWLDEIGRHAYDRGVVQELIARGLFVGVPLPGLYRVLLPGAGWDVSAMASKRAELQAQLEPVRRAIQDGAPFIISSDAGVRFTHFQDFSQSLEVAVLALGLTPMEAIVAATCTAAQALGLEDQVGTIEVGKRADLVLVDGDPLADIRAIGRVRWVIRQGQVAARDRLLVLAPDQGAGAG